MPAGVLYTTRGKGFYVAKDNVAVKMAGTAFHN
jgi:hypothetical protein